MFDYDLYKIAELNFSRNLLEEINQDMFKGLRGVTTLDLSGNGIRRIPANCFTQLTSLQRLILDGNKIDLDQSSFDGVDTLSSLSLKNNLVSTNSVPYLSRIASLEELLLDNNKISNLVDNTFLNLKNLTTLTVRENSLTRLNPNAFKNTPNISKIDLGKNDLDGNVFNDLRSMTKLRTLTMDSNSFTEVPTDAFSVQTDTLQELDLSGNGLTQSSLQALRKLNKIRSLRLDDNNFNSIPLDICVNISSTLNWLSIKNNGLSTNELINLKVLYELKELHLDGNNLGWLPRGLFSNMFNLRTLTLGHNRLSMITRNTFDGLGRALEYLLLNRNRISRITDDALLKINHLRVLDLSRNRLTTINLPSIMPQLRVLNLSSCQLQRFPDGLRKFTLVDNLDLSGNRMQQLPRITITSSSFIENVDFSNNQIGRIDDLTYVGRIGHLSLKRNQLGTITVDVFDRVTSIEFLDISDNRLSDIPPAVQHASASIVRVNMNNNQITSLSNWIDPSNRRSNIEWLELRGNEISEIQVGVLDTIEESLMKLDLRYNKLTGLNEEVFMKLTRLDTLWLAGNPIACNCELAWLRGLGPQVELDWAECSSPDSVKGALVMCYTIADCSNLANDLYTTVHSHCTGTRPPTTTTTTSTTVSTSTTTWTTTTTTTATTTTTVMPPSTTSPSRALSSSSTQLSSTISESQTKFRLSTPITSLPSPPPTSPTTKDGKSIGAPEKDENNYVPIYAGVSATLILIGIVILVVAIACIRQRKKTVEEDYQVMDESSQAGSHISGGFSNQGYEKPIESSRASIEIKPRGQTKV